MGARLWARRQTAAKCSYWLTESVKNGEVGMTEGATIMVLARAFFWFVAAITACILAPAAHAASPVFLNPNEQASYWRDFGGSPARATLRLVYRQDDSAPDNKRTQKNVTVDVASNWVAVSGDGSTSIFDFRSNRRIDVSPAQKTFTSQNLIGGVAFRIAEIQNRSMLSGALRAAKIDNAKVATECDAQTELGIALPGAEHKTEIRRKGARTEIVCDGEVIGAFEADSAIVVPSSFLLMLAQVRQMHPATRRALAEAKGAPKFLGAYFGALSSTKQPYEWRLQSSTQEGSDYPLPADYANAFAASIDAALGAGAGQVAADAMAGKAAGGAPTLEVWDQHLKEVESKNGIAALTLESLLTVGMFPELQTSCAANSRQSCKTMTALREGMAQDKAVVALMAVALAEQNGKPELAISAMADAATSPNAHHPALGAAFALALDNGGPPVLEAAKKAGAPADPMLLHNAAIKAYPYVPAYWTDAADNFARNYDYERTITLYEVALSLPIPGARPPYAPVMRAKLDTMQRIKRDFGEFFLP